MKLEVVVVASALDDMYRLKDVLQLLAVVCQGDTYINLSKVSMAAALLLYCIM